MKGVRVSATGKNKLAVYIMHTHYQAQYPYTAIPPIEPPTPLDELIPQVDLSYNLDLTNVLTYLDIEIVPAVDLEYSIELYDKTKLDVVKVDNTYLLDIEQPIYEDEFIPYIDYTYAINFVDTSITDEPIEGDYVGVGKEYLIR